MTVMMILPVMYHHLTLNQEKSERDDTTILATVLVIADTEMHQAAAVRE